MLTCRKCQTKIPSGKTLCSSHYSQALAEYRADLANYEQESRKWGSMSQAERKTADAAEEERRLGTYSALLGAGLGAIGWVAANRQHHMDGVYGWASAAVGAALFFLVPPLRYLAGHLARAIFMAVVYSCVAYGCVWLIAQGSSLVASNLDTAKGIGILVGIGCALVAEFLGLHHASAAPRKPTAPKP